MPHFALFLALFCFAFSPMSRKRCSILNRRCFNVVCPLGSFLRCGSYTLKWTGYCFFFPTILARETISVTFCLDSCTSKPFRKEAYFKRREFTHNGSKFFLIREDPFSGGIKNNFDKAGSECVSNTYKCCVHTYNPDQRYHVPSVSFSFIRKHVGKLFSTACCKVVCL